MTMLMNDVVVAVILRRIHNPTSERIFMKDKKKKRDGDNV
jgi:hypothetical protein